VSMLEPSPMVDSSSPEDLLRHARTLIGHSATEIHRANADAQLRSANPPKLQKGLFGRVIEGYFGLPEFDNASEPDFARCGVELKTVPLVWQARRFRTEYRTSISQINANLIKGETWQTASVRKKLATVLFVFYVRGPDPSRSVVREAALWSPGETDYTVMGRDWWEIRTKVIEEARIHEGDSAVLGAARKGAGKGQDLRPLSPGGEPLPSRAFALQPWFTNRIYHDLMSTAVAANIAQDTEHAGAASTYSKVELVLAGALRRYHNRTVESVANELQVPLTERKDIAAHVIRQVARKELLDHIGVELESTGLRLKTIGLQSGSSTPIWDLPMSMVDLRRFRDQRWEESSLHSDLQRLFFITTYSSGRGATQLERSIGWAFAWSPTPEEIDAIRLEWSSLRNRAVSEGLGYTTRVGRFARVRSFPTSSDTQFVHIRGKGSTREDEVEGPRGARVTRQAYWLNKDFLSGVVSRFGGPPRSGEP
jgi:DNA mismatch repair protein MutH